MKILTVVGARPQFVKAAVVSRSIARHNEAAPTTRIEEQILHTGQHYDHGMSQVFFDEMAIPEPAVHLGVGSGSHGEMTGTMLAGIEKEIVARQPDWLLVYGDTNSTLAGALAAAKLHVPVAHIEAGLRSFNKQMPEEVNRILTDHVSDLLFCPSGTSQQLLAKEGITSGVHVVGDVMVDAIHFYSQKAETPAGGDSPFILATLHRAENTDDKRRLRGIVSAFEQAPLPVVLPLHPRTAATFERTGIQPSENVRLVEPLSYFQMLGHLRACSFVMSDSGGLQKEAYVMGKRCLVLRDETEWTELIDAEGIKVVGATTERILTAAAWAASAMRNPEPIYGTGDAGDKIVRQLAG